MNGETNDAIQPEKKSEKGRLFHLKCREARGTGCLSLNTFRVKVSGLKSLFIKVPHLTHVYLSGSHLHGDIPSAFLYLKHLCLLDLSDNKFDYFSPSALMENPVLAVVDLSINKFTRLPKTVGNMKALRELNVAQNDLVELPEELGDLKSLELLNASHNLLRTLPDSLCTGKACESLRTLRVQNNVLAELPEQLGQLTNLGELDIRDNNLHTLPPSAKGLTKLQVLHYVGNRWPVPIVCTSQDVKQQQLDSSYGTRALETLFRLVSGSRLTESPTVYEDLGSITTRSDGSLVTADLCTGQLSNGDTKLKD